MWYCVRKGLFVRILVTWQWQNFYCVWITWIKLSRVLDILVWNCCLVVCNFIKHTHPRFITAIFQGLPVQINYMMSNTVERVIIRNNKLVNLTLDFFNFANKEYLVQSRAVLENLVTNVLCTKSLPIVMLALCILLCAKLCWLKPTQL